jgi:DNA-binding beta-propeller fold protein YncE
MAVDQKTHTIYAGNQNHPRIDVLNAATCNAAHPAGCGPVAQIPMPHKQGNVGAIDDQTHTLYASDPYANTIAVINIAHCNATDTSGCSAIAPTITVGPGPGQPVLDRKTHTLYAPDGPQSNRVAVLNAASCNATNTFGCGQAPVQVPVGNATFNIALSSAKNTIYAPATGFISGNLRSTVAVINGATCNGTKHSGCAHPVATAKVGLAPFGVAVNDRTHTLYVANNQEGDLPGTVSLIDTNTCNGAHTAGCAGHKPTVLVGRSPGNVAVDASNDSIYIANFASAAVSVIDGANCRAGHAGGCATAVHNQPVGSVPQGLAVDPAVASVYAANDFSPPSLSIFKTSL